LSGTYPSGKGCFLFANRSRLPGVVNFESIFSVEHPLLLTAFSIACTGSLVGSAVVAADEVATGLRIHL